MGISHKVSTAMSQGSWIRKMFEEGIELKQKYGAENIFDLSIGNPVMNPPKQFFEELMKIAQAPISGMHRYMPNAGLTNTRAAVASQKSLETGLAFTYEDIIMTCGAAGALNVVLKSILDPDDEIVIFAPYFVDYEFYTSNHGGVCKIVPPAEGFFPDMDALKESINEKTRGVLINSPNNPSGIVYSAEVISEIAQIIISKEKEFGIEIFLINDEPYKKIIFDEIVFPDIFQYHKRTIVATSYSKDLAIPGERIGYIAVNPNCNDKKNLMGALVFCNRVLGFINAPALMQHIVTNLQATTIDVDSYQRKRDFLYRSLINMGYDVVNPQAAFYMFPRSPIKDDVEFVQILKKHKVLTVPGVGFGLEGFFRISYCLEDETLEGSLPGLHAAINEVKG
jgi:aspartate aminotransferase